MDGGVPVGVRVPIEGPEDDGEDHLAVLRDERNDVIVVPEEQRALRHLGPDRKAGEDQSERHIGPGIGQVEPTCTFVSSPDTPVHRMPRPAEASAA